MKTVVHSDLWDSTLARWRGADVQIWMYHATHSRMAIRVFREGEQEVLYIVAVGCGHITAPFYWAHSALKILPGGVDTERESDWRILDESAGLVLRCSGVALALAPASDFDTTFFGFLGDVLPEEE